MRRICPGSRRPSAAGRTRGGAGPPEGEGRGDHEDRHEAGDPGRRAEQRRRREGFASRSGVGVRRRRSAPVSTRRRGAGRPPSDGRGIGVHHATAHRPAATAGRLGRRCRTGRVSKPQSPGPCRRPCTAAAGRSARRRPGAAQSPLTTTSSAARGARPAVSSYGANGRRGPGVAHQVSGLSVKTGPPAAVRRTTGPRPSSRVSPTPVDQVGGDPGEAGRSGAVADRGRHAQGVVRRRPRPARRRTARGGVRARPHAAASARPIVAIRPTPRRARRTADEGGPAGAQGPQRDAQHGAASSVVMRAATSSAVGARSSPATRPSARNTHPVGVRGGDRVVGDHDDGLAVPVDQAAQQAEHLAAGAGVERAGRLVGEEHRRAG